VTEPDPTSQRKPEETPADIVNTLFRVARTFMVPFIGSWMIAYIGGQFEMEWLYYAGLGGVGVSIIGLLLWLLHH
jgi:hypothetical protein